MVRDELSVLSAFLAVAEERSFTRAAKRLGVTPSALSHAIRELEERFGVRLLARTTRSVAPTDAGAQLVARLFRVASQADIPARLVEQPMHQRSTWLRRRVPLGVRQGQAVTHCCRERTADRR